MVTQFLRPGRRLTHRMLATTFLLLLNSYLSVFFPFLQSTKKQTVIQSVVIYIYHVVLVWFDFDFLFIDHKKYIFQKQKKILFIVNGTFWNSSLQYTNNGENIFHQGWFFLFCIEGPFQFTLQQARKNNNVIAYRSTPQWSNEAIFLHHLRKVSYHQRVAEMIFLLAS